MDFVCLKCGAAASKQHLSLFLHMSGRMMGDRLINIYRWILGCIIYKKFMWKLCLIIFSWVILSFFGTLLVGQVVAWSLALILQVFLPKTHLFKPLLVIFLEIFDLKILEGVCQVSKFLELVWIHFEFFLEMILLKTAKGRFLKLHRLSWFLVEIFSIVLQPFSQNSMIF